MLPRVFWIAPYLSGNITCTSQNIFHSNHLLFLFLYCLSILDILNAPQRVVPTSLRTTGTDDAGKISDSVQQHRASTYSSSLAKCISSCLYELFYANSPCLLCFLHFSKYHFHAATGRNVQPQVYLHHTDSYIVFLFNF